MGVHRPYDAPKNLIAANGDYLRVQTYEDAVEAMKYITRIQASRDIESERKTMKLYSLINFGVAALAGGLLEMIGLPSPVCLILTLAAAVIAIACTAVKCSGKIREIKAKSEAVLTGEYFNGKPEQQIIREANESYIARMNNLIGLEKRFSK